MIMRRVAQCASEMRLTQLQEKECRVNVFCQVSAESEPLLLV